MKKRPPVTRLRQLTPSQEKRLDVLRRVSGMLDSAMLVPGTGIRFGLDPILGLIPGLGDFVSPLFTIGILWQARDLSIPKVVQLRMIFNVAIDTLVGIVPVAGDLFDVAWKANDMNMALLERHAYEEHPASTRDWVFVSSMIALLVVLAVAPLLLLGWVTSLVAGMFN
ncbi:MAG TPA: DUF4112 domain-containing protein [Gemmatimonadaceae bacterium]|nr:DUF4112 domain-containing protein [Gemmatimonadaceae bacterium]